MLHLADTNDRLRVVTSAAVTTDVVASFSDLSGTTVTPGKQLTAITTATTTTVVTEPGASTVRRVHTLFVRNKHASTPVDVTVLYQDNATDYEIHKATLLAGEMLEYVEGLGWFTVQTVRKEVYFRRVTSTYVNATTSFSDVTGLTCPVTSGKHYLVNAQIMHFANASTSGPRFAFGGVAMTAMRIGCQIMESGGVAAAVMNGNVGDVTAIDTAVAATTDSSTTLVTSGVLGWINPSASGTFAFRACSEVAVAAGITIAIGSWMTVTECDN